MKNSFLYILLKQHKPWFVLTVLLICLQAFFMVKGVETTPFFNYGMYSNPASAPSAYQQIELYVQEGDDEQKLDLNALYSANIIQYQLHFFNQLTEQDSVDHIQTTIDKRFNKKSALNKLLTQQLSNDKGRLKLFKPWLSTTIKKDIFSIYRSSYSWQNNQFKLIKKQAID